MRSNRRTANRLDRTLRRNKRSTTRTMIIASNEPLPMHMTLTLENVREGGTCNARVLAVSTAEAFLAQCRADGMPEADIQTTIAKHKYFFLMSFD